MFNHWQIYALSSAFFAGLVVLFSKMGVESVSSNMAVFIRTLVIIAFLMMMISVRGEWINPLSLNRKSFIFLILSGLATGLSWICYFRALQTGPASGVAPMDKLSLVFAVVLAVLVLGEHLNWQQWLGVVLMGGGAFLIAFK